MKELILVLVVILAIKAAYRAWKEDDLLKTNPEAWKAMKEHKENTKGRKWEALAKGGFALFRWWMKW